VRIATMIITLFLMLIVGLQSCVGSAGGSITSNEKMSQGGAIGMLVALLWLIAAAFVIGVPWVSLLLFAISAVFALAAGATTPYTDLTIWGVVALALALFSILGIREKNRKRRTAE
jgi:hypothetical protein